MKQHAAISFVLLCIGIFITGLYGPWYAPACFILVFTIVLKHNRKEALLISMLAGVLVFSAMAAWMLIQDNSGLIEKTGNLLGGLSPFLMVTVTAIIGGVTGLVSGWLGHTIRQIITSTSK
jgi:hypothetical protein